MAHEWTVTKALLVLASTCCKVQALLTFPPPPTPNAPAEELVMSSSLERFRLELGKDDLVQPLTFTVEGSSNTSLELRWAYPEEFVPRVENYLIECALYILDIEPEDAEIITAVCPAAGDDAICRGTELQYILGGLESNREYGCAVQAVGTRTTSTPAGPSFGRTIAPIQPIFPPPPPPEQPPPTNLRGNPGSGEVLLTWEEPENVDRMRIQYYTIITNPQGDGFAPDNVLVRDTETTNPPTIAIVSPLQNNVAYEFRVTATSEMGESRRSNVVVLTPTADANIYDNLENIQLPETPGTPSPSQPTPPRADPDRNNENDTVVPLPGPDSQCSDEAPDSEFTCAEQAFVFAKCDEEFMADKCHFSCGRCAISGRFVNGTTV
uniref:Fibronectin type-III domain-containing protein n=1 Tax=Picocystis salinarum TaxID=88271 RepID=A0A7S3UBD1_9CHLO